MTLSTRRGFVLMGAGTLLAGCSLPRGAVNGYALLASASDQATPGDYAIYQVTKPFLSVVADWPVTGAGPRGGWLSGGASGGTRVSTIKPGDVLDLTVWDNSETSLLASSGQKVVPLTKITVAPDGKIFVPYLDRVPVAGRTVETARAELQTQLTAIAPSAQVQLSFSAGRRNSVDAIGGVGSPGSYPLPDGGLTVLGLIATAGGVSPSLAQPIVRLVRGGNSYVTTLSRLYENPALDTGLQGGDQIIVVPESRTFVALGAAGKQQIVPFPDDPLNALTAIAAIGGVNASRGDPKAILILRQYARQSVRDGISGPGAERTIFVLDLTTADGLFSAGRFLVNPDDVIYVSESPVTTFQTIASLVGSVFGLTAQVSNASGG